MIQHVMESYQRVLQLLGIECSQKLTYSGSKSDIKSGKKSLGEKTSSIKIFVVFYYIIGLAIFQGRQTCIFKYPKTTIKNFRVDFEYLMSLFY